MPYDSSTPSNRRLKGTTSEDYQPKAESLSDLAKKDKNRTMLGDPISMKAEAAVSEPTEKDKGAQGPSKERQKNRKGDSKI